MQQNDNNKCRLTNSNLKAGLKCKWLLCKLIKMITPKTHHEPRPQNLILPHTDTDMTLLNAPVTIVLTAIVAIVVVVASLSNCMQFLQQIPNGGKLGKQYPNCAPPSPTPSLSPAQCMFVSCMSQLFSYALDLLCFRSCLPQLAFFLLVESSFVGSWNYFERRAMP